MEGRIKLENKQELMRYTGSIQQAAYVRPVIYGEGRASGMKAWEVKNGRLQYTVMADKCLDIAQLSYRGETLNFISKPGLAGRNHYDTNGTEAQRSIMGGMLFTCGLENIGAPCTAQGRDYPMHGRIRTTPAEHMSGDAWWEGDSYCMEVSGEMREAELFGENLVLRRRISSVLGERSIHIQDRIANEAFRAEPFYLLYHFNIGWPLLGPACELIVPAKHSEPRDEAAARHMEQWQQTESPKDNEPEQVFLHELAADEVGNTFAAVYNHELQIGLKIGFNQKHLPYFMQWKSMASGDYVLGLEPANASVHGKLYHMERKDEPMLEAGQEITVELELTILDGDGELQAVKREADELKHT